MLGQLGLGKYHCIIYLELGEFCVLGMFVIVGQVEGVKNKFEHR